MLLSIKYLFYGSLVVTIVFVIAFAYNNNYFSYYNCMSQTKSKTITQKGADHVARDVDFFFKKKQWLNKKNLSGFHR